MADISKDEFAAIARRMIEQLVALPDDIWESTYPIMAIERGDETITVGIEGEADEDD